MQADGGQRAESKEASAMQQARQWSPLQGSHHRTNSPRIHGGQAQDIVLDLHERGVSYTALAALCGVEFATISKIANGLISGRNTLWRLWEIYMAVTHIDENA